MRSLGKFYPSLGISHNLIMGLGVSDFVSVGHIVAFLSSHYTFWSRARILKRKSRRLGESRICHSLPLLFLAIRLTRLGAYSVLRRFYSKIITVTRQVVNFGLYALEHYSLVGFETKPFFTSASKLNVGFDEHRLISCVSCMKLFWAGLMCSGDSVLLNIITVTSHGMNFDFI